MVTKPSLLTRYETLRRQEFELLTALINTLGKVDNLPAGQMEQARDGLFHADHPYLIVLMGGFNTGKSSMINALIGEPVLETGATPTTNKIAILRNGNATQRIQAGDVETIFSTNPLLEKVSFVDTPGLDSIFKEHDETTRKFLHRADIVLLVMLSTQVMTARNVEYLQALRAYGKKIIIVVNQIDLVDAEERETLKTFIADQSRQHLGIAPEVWMLSSKLAIQAQHPQSAPAVERESANTTPTSAGRDEALWAESGFAQVEAYINNALSDAERVRQKLETPLQIARNVLSVSLAQTREQQDALAEYRRSAQNVRGQIEAGLREQQVTISESTKQIAETFAETISRGREAIRDVFLWAKAFSLMIGGLLEITGLARLFRRVGGGTPAKTAFTARRVSEPLAQILEQTDRIAPRLEGRDIKDVEDLIRYTRKEMDRLPEGLRGKVIGKLESPASYDRSILPKVRDELTVILNKAREVEFQRIDSAVRGSIAVLGLYEATVLIIGLGVTTAAIGANNSAWVLTLVVTIVLALGGLLLAPFRGRVMEQSYANRMRGFADEYEKIVKRAAEEQVAYGKRMREDAVAPFMRLVETQIAAVDTLRAELEFHEGGITRLEKELGTLKD